CPLKLSLLERMSMPAWLTPPITGKSPSPETSESEFTGEFDDPETFLPKSPDPDAWRAMVITPAPQWSATWTVHVPGGWTRLFEVSSYTISAAPVLSMVMTKKSARFRLPWLSMQPVPCRHTSS